VTRTGLQTRVWPVTELVLAGTRQHLWADDITDSYAFSGNSSITAGRIEKSAARVLGVRH